MHPWPHRDGAGPGIVEGGPCWGAPTIVAAIVTGATGATVLAFPLPLTLAFTAVVGVGVEGGGAAGGHISSCCGGHGRSYCSGGRLPPDGAE
jgi:hypothetical protein